MKTLFGCLVKIALLLVVLWLLVSIVTLPLGMTPPVKTLATVVSDIPADNSNNSAQIQPPVPIPTFTPVPTSSEPEGGCPDFTKGFFPPYVTNGTVLHDPWAQIDRKCEKGVWVTN